jgi:hypothetical protein
MRRNSARRASRWPAPQDAPNNQLPAPRSRHVGNKLAVSFACGIRLTLMHARSNHGALPRHRGRKASWLVTATCSVFAWAGAACAGTDPDYFAAREFGRAMQQDFLTHRSKALIDRLDSQAMMARVFGPFGSDALTDPNSQEMWEKFTFPSLVRELGTYDESYTLIVSRVVLLDASRTLECILLDKNYSIRLLTLRLKRAADGKIRIEDLRFSGSELEVSRMQRQCLILLGYRTNRLLDPEEESLSSLASKHIMRASEIFSAMRDSKYDWAFTLMCGDFRNLNETRIWRELRNRLATFGCAPAQRHLEAACSSGQITDSFLRYAILSSKGDNARTLEALEQVLIEYREPPILRAMKAQLLLEMDRVSEAFNLARSLYERNPLSGTAHYVAARAASRTADMTAVFAALDSWQMFTSRDEIDELLQQDPAMTSFRDSARYVAWRGASPAAVAPATELAPVPK